MYSTILNHEFQRVETGRGILQGEDIPQWRKYVKYLHRRAGLRTKHSFTLAKNSFKMPNELNFCHVSLQIYIIALLYYPKLITKIFYLPN